MNKIFKTDITEKREFTRINHSYKMIASDEQNHIYLFEITPLEWEKSYEQFELVKGVKVKNPDGRVVYRYPSDEQFGQYGWYICGTLGKCIRDINNKYEELTGNKEFNELLEL